MNENLLIKRCQEGSRKDLEELVRRYYYALVKFFSKYSLSIQVCEDLTHDTIIKMIENIERYKIVKDTKFSTWLFTIAHNTLINYLNKASNQFERDSFLEFEDGLYSNENTEEEAIKNFNYSRVLKKIEFLSVEDRTLINLRYHCDLDYKEISKVMGIQEKTVKWKLHSAIEKLRKLFKKEVSNNELSKV